ncbi:hypothetical protein BJ508DRAFT_344545 [Ascobolus immersus RN42]|uniref:Uncharacterized protein n=1 Tax=Ascobolus immersus RN42 TaxID=1160509 RepID=A0A3N4I8D7_ASCIM|nr:hypothetical protein BJ508DRAFT_344545 [Ascobolus immersus RN42]
MVTPPPQPQQVPSILTSISILHATILANLPPTLPAKLISDFQTWYLSLTTPSPSSLETLYQVDPTHLTTISSRLWRILGHIFSHSRKAAKIRTLAIPGYRKSREVRRLEWEMEYHFDVIVGTMGYLVRWYGAERVLERVRMVEARASVGKREREEREEREAGEVRCKVEVWCSEKGCGFEEETLTLRKARVGIVGRVWRVLGRVISRAFGVVGGRGEKEGKVEASNWV